MPSYDDDDDDDGTSLAEVEMVEAYDFLMKFIIIGESGTGKSCLLHHFIQNTYKEYSQHTIGVEFASRVVKIGERRIKLQLWDTAGQERFRSVTRSYYRGASGALLVFDITNRSTFTSLQRWLDDARALASPQLVTVLIGAKCDREEDRQVSWNEASRWAAERDIHYLEASSLSDFQTELPFLFITRSILLSIESGVLDPEKAGSGVSYGDRLLRRVRSGSMWSGGAGGGSGSSRLSALLVPVGRRRLGGMGGKCC